MTSADAIKQNLSLSAMIWAMLTDDFTEDERFVRAVPGGNHAAWLMGHLIVAERRFLEMLGSVPPELPPGFEEVHSSAGASADGPDGFLTLAGYRELAAAVRASLIAAIDGMSDADFAKPVTGRMAGITPTLGHLLVLTGNHSAFHCGQLSTIRRKLGKPVKF